MNNLADPQQVERAKRQEEDLRKQELNDIRTLMGSSSGRRFMWRLLEKCNTFGSIWNADAQYMNYLSGKQDLGHFIMDEIVKADENLLFKLMKENKKGEIQ